MAPPSAPHRSQAGPLKTLAVPALPSGFIGMRTMSPISVFATSMSPGRLNAIPFAPNGPRPSVTVGPTMPHGPGAVVPFNNELPDHIVTSPFLARHQIAPPAVSETYRL